MPHACVYVFFFIQRQGSAPSRNAKDDITTSVIFRTNLIKISDYKIAIPFPEPTFDGVPISPVSLPLEPTESLPPPPPETLGHPVYPR